MQKVSLREDSDLELGVAEIKMRGTKGAWGAGGPFLLKWAQLSSRLGKRSAKDFFQVTETSLGSRTPKFANQRPLYWKKPQFPISSRTQPK